MWALVSKLDIFVGIVTVTTGWNPNISISYNTAAIACEACVPISKGYPT